VKVPLHPAATVRTRANGIEPGKRPAPLRRIRAGEFNQSTTARTRQARRADASQRGEQGLDGRFAAAQHRLERIAEHSPQRR
jgi:hypothetical protein